LQACELEFAFEQTLATRSAKRVLAFADRPEAISGTPLLEQEFALREAAVGKGLEVRIYSYTDRKKQRINS